MPRVLAWQCPKTGNLFADKADYRAHLGKIARQHLDARREFNLRTHFNERRRELLRSSSFEDIARWLEANVDLLNARNRDRSRWGRRVDREKKGPVSLTEVRFVGMRWDACCSNSHVAPLGKRTNWGGRYPDEPRGYPGYHGSIEFCLRNFNRFPTDVFKHTGVCTGGGGGSDKARYEVTLFDDDFPLLRLMDKMRGDA